MLSTLNLLWAERNYALEAISEFYQKEFKGRQPKVQPADYWARLKIDFNVVGLPVGFYNFDTPRGQVAPGGAIANTAWDTSLVKQAEQNAGNFFLGHGLQFKFWGYLSGTDIQNLYSTLQAMLRVRYNENIELELPIDFIPNGIDKHTDSGQFGTYGLQQQEIFWGFGGQVMLLQPNEVVNFQMEVLTGIAAAIITNTCYATIRMCGEKVLPLS